MYMGKYKKKMRFRITLALHVVDIKMKQQQKGIYVYGETT